MSDTQGNKTSLLTKQQFTILNEALQGASNVNLISDPEVITSNGRQTGMDIVTTIPVNGTNANVSIGLDVTPDFSAFSSTFSLKLVAKLDQLVGGPLHPSIETTQITNQVSLLPGQTFVLEKTMPDSGWLSRLPTTRYFTAGPVSLLVFVTPQAVDSRGSVISR
jgi:type II secretory pathway component GspD/PulD (secretin)